MTQETPLSKTMLAVMESHSVVQSFHRNISDMFRGLAHILEDGKPPYELLDGTVLTATLQHSLRTSSRWGTRHFCVAYEPIEDENLPLLFAHVCVDPDFSPEPELWLGVFVELETQQATEKAVEYLFEEYFTPDENWTESGEWYEETIDDEFVRTFMSFLRLPLHTISGLSALETEVANRLIDRVQELSVPNIDE